MMFFLLISKIWFSCKRDLNLNETICFPLFCLVSVFMLPAAENEMHFLLWTVILATLGAFHNSWHILLYLFSKNLKNY